MQYITLKTTQGTIIFLIQITKILEHHNQYHCSNAINFTFQQHVKSAIIGGKVHSVQSAGFGQDCAPLKGQSNQGLYSLCQATTYFFGSDNGFSF